MSTGADTEASTPERGHDAPFDPLAQSDDAFRILNSVTIVLNAKDVVIQAAQSKRQFQWKLTSNVVEVLGF